MLGVSDVGASPCQVMAEGTWSAHHPFLRLRGVDGGRENGGRAVRGPRGAGTAATDVGGKERTGLETRAALGVIQRSEPS